MPPTSRRKIQQHPGSGSSRILPRYVAVRTAGTPSNLEYTACSTKIDFERPYFAITADPVVPIRSLDTRRLPIPFVAFDEPLRSSICATASSGRRRRQASAAGWPEGWTADVAVTSKPAGSRQPLLAAGPRRHRRWSHAGSHGRCRLGSSTGDHTDRGFRGGGRS